MKIRLLHFFLSALFSVIVVADNKNDSKKININSATIQQLDYGLFGVGKKVAIEIVKHRDAHGNFHNFDDLDKVKYIGRQILDKNTDIILFD